MRRQCGKERASEGRETYCPSLQSGPAGQKPATYAGQRTRRICVLGQSGPSRGISRYSQPRDPGLTEFTEPSVKIDTFPSPHFRMPIQTLIAGRTKPIRTPPPTLGKLCQIILVQELALVAHDAQPTNEMLADRVYFFLFPWVVGLRRGRLEVGRGGEGMAAWAGGAEGASGGGEVGLAYLVVCVASQHEC